MKYLILAAAAAFTLPATAFAQDHVIEVTDGFVRSSNPKSAAAFMTIQNDSAEVCTLAAVETPAAAKAELHTSKENAEGMMEMLPIEGGIAIPAQGSHTLARGGDHVMLMGVTEPLQQGDETPVTLDFGECGKVELLLPVDNERMGTAAPETHAEKTDAAQMSH
ncbi:copper chaperone PCu(A)C [Paracoccus albus]|uniref:copper chaperone PCu(A)C n=1 Tax=Paracoccus albus TaxID=3017784 RepID=UPI0022F0E543|nr:copper chaperone PCu(A)C [Paracoccus albus]WBU59763.1 copper chaperone PCu(A)C [Paracoccus albus]